MDPSLEDMEFSIVHVTSYHLTMNLCINETDTFDRTMRCDIIPKHCAPSADHNLTPFLSSTIVGFVVLNALCVSLFSEAEIEEALKRQRLQQQALDDEEGEEEPELMDEDEIEEPPTKKQKTDKGSKATKNGENTESKKKRKSPQQKAKKSPPQKPVETSLDDKKEEKEKEDKEEKKASPKKDKKMKNMGKGLKYRDMKVGKGKPVANGDKLFVYYVGQLDDKKVFDKCISGKGFDFEFGKGKVIKGWDMGMKGMKKGGKRKLIIPSKLAYGAAGSEPNIPPNAQLTFTIELRNIA